MGLLFALQIRIREYTNKIMVILYAYLLIGAKKSPFLQNKYANASFTLAVYPDFCKNHQFHVIYCLTLAYVIHFEEFLTLDSHRFTVFEE
jgi:hypothetical protein